MFLVRDVFQTKPGMAKELVKKFKKTFPVMEQEGFKNLRIMTDAVAGFWTVVLEYSVNNLSEMEKTKGFTSRPDVIEAMKGYMDLVTGGRREIYRIE
jgi:hypothetical protein